MPKKLPPEFKRDVVTEFIPLVRFTSSRGTPAVVTPDALVVVKFQVAGSVVPSSHVRTLTVLPVTRMRTHLAAVVAVVANVPSCVLVDPTCLKTTAVAELEVNSTRMFPDAELRALTVNFPTVVPDVLAKPNRTNCSESCAAVAFDVTDAADDAVLGQSSRSEFDWSVAVPPEATAVVHLPASGAVPVAPVKVSAMTSTAQLST